MLVPAPGTPWPGFRVAWGSSWALVQRRCPSPGSGFREGPPALLRGSVRSQPWKAHQRRASRVPTGSSAQALSLRPRSPMARLWFQCQWGPILLAPGQCPLKSPPLKCLPEAARSKLLFRSNVLTPSLQQFTAGLRGKFCDRSSLASGLETCILSDFHKMYRGVIILP